MAWRCEGAEKKENREVGKWEEGGVRWCMGEGTTAVNKEGDIYLE